MDLLVDGWAMMGFGSVKQAGGSNVAVLDTYYVPT